MNTLPKNPLLEQFLSEARELLEGIGQKLMQLEEAPAIGPHQRTLSHGAYTQGQQRLFTFPEMTACSMPAKTCSARLETERWRFRGVGGSSAGCHGFCRPAFE